MTETVADRLEAAKPGWLPISGHVVNFTFSLTERQEAVDALRSHVFLKARIQELETELASCRACREKIDCISRDWNYTGPGLLGPSCKD